MPRRERGQVAAEYVGMLLLVAVIVAALIVASPSIVAVVVPGMNNELNNFTGGDAERVQHQASQFDPNQVATIQWLGYDTPEGIGLITVGNLDDVNVNDGIF